MMEPAPCVRDQHLAATAAVQGSAALAELCRYAQEGPNHPPFGDVEVIELLVDATKLAIEVVGTFNDPDRDELYAALCRYLQGWA